MPLEQLSALFEPELLDEIEQVSKRIKVDAGDVILDVGQRINHIPLILEGNVRISRPAEDGRELLLYYVNPNEGCAFTFSCCMQQTVSEIRAVAEESVTLLAIPVAVMDTWMVKYPGWKTFVMSTMRGRFVEMIKTIDQIAFQHLDQRLISYLKDKKTAAGSSVINVSHQQIADDLATSRVVISRLLKKLESEKKILLYRNQVKIMNGL